MHYKYNDKGTILHVDEKKYRIYYRKQYSKTYLKITKQFNIPLLNEINTLKESKNQEKKKYNIILNKYNDNPKKINKIIKIQSLFRGKFIRDVFGPGLLNRKLSINTYDLYTGEDVMNIPVYYYFSFKHNNDIYSFDIRTLRKIIKKRYKISVKNPYNNLIIPQYVIYNFKKREYYIEKHNINILNIESNLSKEQLYNEKLLHVFNEIDKLGNYTSIHIFDNLTINKLLKLISFIKKLLREYNKYLFRKKKIKLFIKDRLQKENVTTLYFR